MEFNSMTLLVDEWGTFMHKWDEEIVPGLTSFYDVVVPYAQHRRGKDIRIKIEKPQLTILAGSTPSNLMQFMPNFAWGQGFTSRIILVHSDKQHEGGDDFAHVRREPPKDMLTDIDQIYKLQGEFGVSDEYRRLAREWRAQGEEPKPRHPKLEHYAVRRRANLYKLSMVSAVDRGNVLLLEGQDFTKALEWLLEAELVMPKIFEAGMTTVEAQAIDEVVAWVTEQGKPVPAYKVLRFAQKRLPTHSIDKVMVMMETTRRLHVLTTDGKGNKMYATGDADT
jgi:hypothetical protein